MRNTSHQGFTLIELLVVIAIIGLLATMVVPAVTSAMDSAARTADASNLSGIFKSQKVHTSKSKQTWAIPKANADSSKSIMVYTSGAATKFGATPAAAAAGTDIMDPEKVTYLITTASFWELARVNDISSDLFSSPLNPDKLIVDPAINLIGVDWTDSGKSEDRILKWAGNSTVGGRQAYAFDWAAPKTSGSTRPLLANRDTELFEGDAPNIVYADGHLGKPDDFTVVVGTGASTTNAPNILNKLAPEFSGTTETDNIYTNVKDATTVATHTGVIFGRGSKYRTYLK